MHADPFIDDIIKHATGRRLPDRTPYQSLSVEDIEKLAHRFNASGRKIELAALENGVIPERYARNFHSFNIADQIKLLQSTVSVVGLGGLGGAVVEILARIGVGHLILIDGDRFEESNLNRQLLSSCDVLGASKSDTALRRVRQINPSLAVVAHGRFLDTANAEELIRGSHVVVDCLDNLPSRFCLQSACRETGSVMISAAVAGTTGQLLSIFPGDEGLQNLYGIPGEAPEKGAETALGNLPQIVVAMASLECAEIVKVILNRGTPLRHRLLIVDLWDNTFDIMDLK
jgi:molybdopterin/thiamine biosynthesis adenylyltransferase